MYQYPEENRFPNRKYPRLKKYDYNTPNYYFVTLCTGKKSCIFGQPGELNPFGKIAEEGLLQIKNHFPGVEINHYVIMPNHIHVILVLSDDRHNLCSVIGTYKSYVSKRIHEKDPNREVWQKSFYDHIIRSQKSYEKIWNYIETNPMRWGQDCFYEQ